MKNPILPIVAGLLVTLAVGMTTAAASAPAASENAPMVKVRIHLKGTAVPVYRQLTEFRGRFTLSGATYTRVGGRFIRSGAISDRGTFVHRGLPNFPPPYVRTLRGAKGTIWVSGRLSPGWRRTPEDAKGRWRITNATGAYAGLRGQGQDRGVTGGNRVDVTMTGTLLRRHIG